MHSFYAHIRALSNFEMHPTIKEPAYTDSCHEIFDAPSARTRDRSGELPDGDNSTALEHLTRFDPRYLWAIFPNISDTHISNARPELTLSSSAIGKTAAQLETRLCTSAATVSPIDDSRVRYVRTRAFLVFSAELLSLIDSPGLAWTATT